MKRWATSIPGAVLLCTFALCLQSAAAVSSASQSSQTQQPSAQAGSPPTTQPNPAQPTAPPSGGQQAQHKPAQQTPLPNAGQQAQQKPVPKPAKPGHYFEARVKLPHGSPLTPAQIVATLKMPLPFYLEPSAQPAPDGSILIYCKEESADKCDSDLLQKLESDIVALAGDSKTVFIRIEHAKYLPDIVKQAQALNYDGVTVAAAGPNSMKITRTAAVSPEQYAAFKAALDELFWKFKTQAPASRVYYLNAGDAATALGGGPAKSDKGGGSGSGGASATVTVQNLAASNAGPCPASGTPPAGGAAKGAKAAPGANKAGKSKSDSGAASDGSGGDDAAKSSDGNSVTGCPPAASTAPASDSGKMSKDSSKPALSVSPVNGDVLVFSPDATPADAEAIAQSRRVLALIDFPRPEVLINTLSFQASSSSAAPLAEGDRITAHESRTITTLCRSPSFVRGNTSNEKSAVTTLHKHGLFRLSALRLPDATLSRHSRRRRLQRATERSGQGRYNYVRRRSTAWDTPLFFDRYVRT